MRGMCAIVKKELRCYFYSPAAYIIIGVFVFFMGIVFTKFVAIYQQYNMAQRFGGGGGITLDKVATYLYQNMAFWMCLLAPFLTMRLFAEEKRQQTFELLFTSPVRIGEMVLGKFLSAFILTLAMMAVSFVYVLFMVLWGTPDIAIIGTTYIGLVLSVGCYIAIGTLISSLTASQAIAAVLTIITLIFLWLLQSLAQGMTAKLETPLGTIEWGPTLNYLSPLSHFTSFSEGLIHAKDLVYFASFLALMLFFTHRVIESNRWR